MIKSLTPARLQRQKYLFSRDIQGPHVSKAGNKTNTEVADLHTVTQRYGTPEVLRRQSLPFRLHIIMHNTHKPHALLLKTLPGFVPTFLQIQMWFQKTEK